MENRAKSRAEAGKKVYDRKDVWTAGVLLLAAFALYLRTMPPTILDSDSGEYQYMAYILGVMHSTGYPLHILLGKLFTFIPIGEIAYRLNLTSVVFAAASAPFIYLAARRLITHRGAAFIASLSFVVTPSMWGAAVEPKSYALHLLLGVLTILFALRWYQEGKRTDFYSLAFLVGLGLTNHIIYRFLAPALLLLLWLRRASVDRKMIIRGGLLLFVPLLLYAYIPIRANQLISQQDPDNWELYGRDDAMLKGTVTAYYNNTPEGLFKFITGLDNIYKLDVKSPLESTNRIDLSVALLLQQFGVWGVALSVLGAYALFRQDRNAFLILLGVAVGNGAVAFYLKGISTVYYYLLTYLVLAFWAGKGIERVLLWLRQSRSKIPLRRLEASGIASLLFIALPVGSLLTNYSTMDQSNNVKYRQDAEAILRENLPPNAVVSAPWEVSQPLRYLQFVENKRPDLLVVNLSPVGMSEKQFNYMLASANRLKRPFYLIEYNPELKTSPLPRTVQAIPLPLMQEPTPRYRLENTSVVAPVQVLGYDLDPDPPQPGKPTRVWIYYRARERMYPMYSAILSVSDITGRPWLDISGFPVSYYFPTFRWYELGEYYRDGWTMTLPAEAPDGLYNLDLNWLVYDLGPGKPDFANENRVSLGTIRVGVVTAESVPNPDDAKIGKGLSYRGWGAEQVVDGVVRGERGKPLNIDLYWRAEEQLERNYTIFVHLIDPKGAVVQDADGQPLHGLFPMERWTPGETVRDRHTLALKPDLAPGTYTIGIGVYSPETGERQPVRVGSQTAPDGRIIIAQVKVE